MDLKRNIVFFDLETTGLDIQVDEIIQISMTKINTDGGIDQYEQKFNPNVPIKPESEKVHGLTMDVLKDEPRFSACIDDILGFIGDSDIGGYNIIYFDVPMLIEKLARHAVIFDISDRKIVDVFRMYQKFKPHSLAGAYKELFGKEIENAHDASADVKATIDVLFKLTEKDENVGHTTEQWEQYGFDRSRIVDLAGKFIRNDSGTIVFNFGNNKGTPVFDNVGFLQWMVGKNFTSDTLQWVNRLLHEYHYGSIEEEKKRMAADDQERPVFE